MKLFDTFFESLKITWKNKPMWKFNFFIYIPIFLISVFIYAIPIVFLSLEENGISPISLGKNGETILNVLVIFTTLLYLAVYLGGFVAIQLGTNIQCWQESNSENISRKGVLFKAILRKILPSLPGYLVFIILPYLLILGGSFGLLFLVEETGEPAIFLLVLMFFFAFLLVYYVGIYLTYVFLPVTLHENISFKNRVKLAWQYLSNHFWDVFIYSLIVGVFGFIANMIIFIPYMVIYMILYIPTIMLMVQADGETFFIIFAVFMAIIMVVGVLIAGLKNLVITANQTALTRFYYQKYTSSKEMQRIAPVYPHIQLEE